MASMNLYLDETTKRTDFSICPISTSFLGRAQYQANYTVRIESEKVNLATQIHDQFTSIDRTIVSSPYFILGPDSKRALQDLATKVAFEVVKERFEKQCQIFEKNHKDYEIKKWEINYSHPGPISVTNGRPDTSSIDYYDCNIMENP